MRDPALHVTLPRPEFRWAAAATAPAMEAAEMAVGSVAEVRAVVRAVVVWAMAAAATAGVEMAAARAAAATATVVEAMVMEAGMG